MCRYKAIVVGLGNMGQGYDYDCPDDARVQTHARAFALHQGFDLVAGVDPSPAARERFAEKYGPAYSDLATAWERHEPQVVALVVPTGRHLEILEQILLLRPKAVLCEKPLAQRLPDAQRMVVLAENSGCALLVNYVRRFDPGVHQLRQTLRQGIIGDVYKAVVWYSKGLVHSGSHFMDLLMFLFGQPGKPVVHTTGEQWHGMDPEPDFMIPIGGVHAHFLAARERCFPLHTAELLGTKGMIRYYNSGHAIEIRRARSESQGGPSTLAPSIEVIPSDLKRYQWHVLENLKRHLDESEHLLSDGRSALATQTAIENVISLLQGRNEK